MHIIGSFISTGITRLALKRYAGFSDSKSVNIALSFSFSLGLAKEIHDSRQERNIFSYKDISANLLGSLLAYLVVK
ncbi:MAG: DUF2279 domain-containing protein [Calditrichaeota bacterium]|nr:MAG: DUF2279 domain-containing protein [Calditrichota bacterium]MBL1204470.1 DUF2279 domain-containing protein [Calditrichota bacterium]NOG44299.1 DUF2279 domain-containing protein [Calditrichota bacterium]